MLQLSPGKNKVKARLRRLAAQALSWGMLAQAQAASLLAGLPWASGTPAALGEPAQVLVVHLFEIGDVVMLTPFLRELRRFLPSARITLVVKPEVANLVEVCPYVSEVLTYEASYPPYRRFFLLPRQAFLAMRRWRRTRRFDLAVVPSWQADNSYAAFLVCFSGAPVRIGYSETISPRRRRLNRGFDRLYTETLDCAGLKHEVRQNLAVLERLGGSAESEALELWTTPEDEAFVRLFRETHGFQETHGSGGWPTLALCPTAGHSTLKQWPLANFVALARRLHEHGVQTLIVGGPGDRALGAEFEAALGGAVINAVGKTTLRQMAALLRGCAGFVGNDAGPMHIAAAVGVPVVALFGSSCPHRYGPWGAGHRALSLSLPCSPCGRGHDAERCVRCLFSEPRCLTEMSVDSVLEAVLAGLQNAAVEPGDTIPQRRVAQ